MPDPFHDGERWVQQKTGEQAIGQNNGRIIAPDIHPKFVSFLDEQRLAILGFQVTDGSMWASVVYGPQGFIQASASEVRLAVPQYSRAASDPLWSEVRVGSSIGVLALDFMKRTRVRVNGTVQSITDDAIHITVSECFPNCPKYIQRRECIDVAQSDPTAPVVSVEGSDLGEEQQRMFTTADTFFLSSLHAEQGADVSHRGGQPGFVCMKDARTLRFPDYPGNSMFNSLGNLTLNPAIGLLVLDYTDGRVLQATGTAALFWEEPDEGDVSGGTNRFMEITITSWKQYAYSFPFRWEYVDASPFNPEAVLCPD